MKKQKQVKQEHSPRQPKDKKGLSDTKLFSHYYTSTANASTKLLEPEVLLKEVGALGVEMEQRMQNKAKDELAKLEALRIKKVHKMKKSIADQIKKEGEQ